MEKKHSALDDLPADFYKTWEDANISLGVAKEQETLADGLLDIVLSQLMNMKQKDSIESGGKGISIEQQKRDAKADHRYFKALAALAKAQSTRVIAASRVEQLRMQHEEWRTRCANRRSHI